MKSPSAVPTEPLHLTSTALQRFTSEAQRLEKLHSDNYAAELRARVHRALQDGAIEEIRDPTKQPAWLMDITHLGIRMFAVVKPNAKREGDARPQPDWAVVLITTGEGHDRNWNSGVWRTPTGAKKTVLPPKVADGRRAQLPQPVAVEDFQVESGRGPTPPPDASPGLTFSPFAAALARQRTPALPVHEVTIPAEYVEAFGEAADLREGFDRALGKAVLETQQRDEEAFVLVWDRDGVGYGTSGIVNRGEVRQALDRARAQGGRLPRVFREVPLTDRATFDF